ncbi:MAG: YdbL family protein [Nibricoccus sp.]
MKKILFSTFFFLLAFGFVAAVRAEDLGAVKTRMAQRLSQVDGMKAKGVVGENNRGLLEARGAGADAAVISAENSDREVVYAALAKQTGTSADQVGRVRAKQIAQRASAGEWIQDESGAWRKK